MQFDILVLGSLTIDEIGGIIKPGGPAFYTYFASLLTDHSIFIIGTVGNDFPWDLPYVLPGMFIKYKKTLRFRHIYDEEAQERVSYLLSRPEYKVNLTLDYLLKKIKPKAVIVNPVYHEFSIDMLKSLYKYDGLLIAYDVQGFLRIADEDNLIKLKRPDTQVLELFEKAHIVKVSDSEKYYLEKPYGEYFVITKGKEGSEVLNGRRAKINAPIIPLPGDPTGAGDVFLLGFVSYLIKNGDLRDALIMGQALASMVVDQNLVPRKPIDNYCEEIKHITKRISMLKTILKERAEKLRRIIKTF